MAGKKGAQVQLQAEISNDEEWEKFLCKKGLLDVYSDWCGPCCAMVGYLKKLKLEVGGDNMHLAIAKSDTITSLERFRNRSEPTWMFISGGKMVNLIFGTNTPRLVELITTEIELELEAQAGNDTRTYLEITQLTDEEQVRFDADQQRRQTMDDIDKAEAFRKVEEKCMQTYSSIAQHITGFTAVVIWPQTQDLITLLVEVWEPLGLAIGNFERIILTRDKVDEWCMHAGFVASELAIEALLEGKCLIWFIKSTKEVDALVEPIETTVARAIYGPSAAPPGDEGCPAMGFLHFRAKPVDVEEESQIKTETVTDNVVQTDGNPDVDADADYEPPAEDPIVDDPVIEETPQPSGELIPGVWTPINDLAKVSVLHSIFPKITTPFLPPEQPVVPAHVAIAFEAFKRKEIMETIEDFEEHILHYGFFTTADPKTTTLVAKNMKEYDKVLSTNYAEKLVLAVVKSPSYPLITLAAMGAIYISDNTVQGEKDCEIFFPDGYEVVEKEEVVPPPEVPGEEEMGDEEDGDATVDRLGDEIVESVDNVPEE